MQKLSQFVGLDVHKDTIVMAVAPGGPGMEVKDMGSMAHDVPTLLRRLKPLGEPGQVHIAYEAGPTGFGLWRALRAAGYSCVVVAPSKTPKASGDRIKTDQRDAAKLARFLRAGELVPVTPPERDAEALRDVLRARDDAVFALRKARQQLSSFLLRHGRRFDGKSTWTQKHVLWIRGQRMDSEAQQRVLEDYVREVERLTKRVADATEHVETLAPATQSCAATFRALQALRGVSTIVAATLVAEIGDLKRFRKASQLMSYLGLVPSEHSSGDTVRRGRITKAGCPSGRWKVVEAAWHARLRPAMTKHLLRRCDGLPQPILDIAWNAQKRLHKRYWAMVNRGKRSQVAVVAVARELCGFVWAIGQALPQPTAPTAS